MWLLPSLKQRQLDLLLPWNTDEQTKAWRALKWKKAGSDGSRAESDLWDARVRLGVVVQDAAVGGRVQQGGVVVSRRAAVALRPLQQQVDAPHSWRRHGHSWRRFCLLICVNGT